MPEGDPSIIEPNPEWKDGTNQEPKSPDFLDDAGPDLKEPEAPQPLFTLTIGVYAEGFNFDLPPDMNYITLAGIAWYLTKQAEIAMGRHMAEQAAEARRAMEAQKKLYVTTDHLPKRGRNN